jgi:hypothetical protein
MARLGFPMNANGFRGATFSAVGLTSTESSPGKTPSTKRLLVSAFGKVAEIPEASSRFSTFLRITGRNRGYQAVEDPTRIRETWAVLTRFQFQGFNFSTNPRQQSILRRLRLELHRALEANMFFRGDRLATALPANLLSRFHCLSI